MPFKCMGGVRERAWGPLHGFLAEEPQDPCDERGPWNHQLLPFAPLVRWGSECLLLKQSHFRPWGAVRVLHMHTYNNTLTAAAVAQPGVRLVSCY